MASLLHQLENNEAILLMYLADELPAEDRLEVESLLQNDASMAAELERLEAVKATVFREMQLLDDTLRLPPQAVAIGRVRSAMKQWATDRAREAALAMPNRRRFPLWGYPLAAAASVGIALMIWWAVLPSESTVHVADEGAIELAEAGTEASPDPTVTTATETLANGLLQAQMASLRESEQELRALQSLSLDSLVSEGSL